MGPWRGNPDKANGLPDVRIQGWESRESKLCRVFRNKYWERRELHRERMPKIGRTSPVFG